MPRQSVEALAAAAFRNDRPLRPEPPASMSPEATQVWRDIISAKPAGLFDAGNFPLLADYCHAVVFARFVDARLNEYLDAEDDKETSRWFYMAVSCTSRMLMLAKALRLTVQQQVDRKARLLAQRGLGDLDDDSGLIGGSVTRRRDQ